MIKTKDQVMHGLFNARHKVNNTNGSAADLRQAKKNNKNLKERNT